MGNMASTTGDALRLRRVMLLLMTMGLALLLAAHPAQAATTFTVNTTNDASDANTTDGVCSTAAGQCSLRAAIEQANAQAGDDVIEFAPSVSGTILLGGNNELAISSNLKINGPGADVLSVSAYKPPTSMYPSVTQRVFSVGSGTTAEISGLTITGAYCFGGGCGIRNEGTLTVSSSTITGNTAYDVSSFYSGGGGIYNLGTLTVQRSTISGNTAAMAGGGIYSKTQPLPDDLDDYRTGHLTDGDTPTTKTTIINSTISGNAANGEQGWGYGGGVYNDLGLTEIEHSTITNNYARSGGGGVASYGDFTTRTDVFSSIIAGNTNTDAVYTNVRTYPEGWNNIRSLGYNLIGNGNAPESYSFNENGDHKGVSDPGLEALSLNGSSTKTHALKATSPALNQGPPDSACADTDQRGVNRPQEGTCDIGSFERDITAPDAPVITSPANNSIDTDGSFTISGTAEPNSSVELFDGSNRQDLEGRVSDSGTWSIDLSDVSDGSHSYTAKVADAAGNISAASEVLTVIVDKTAPGAPRITSPAEGAHLNYRSFSLSGTAETGAKVELFEGILSKGTATADTYGKWRISLSGVSEGSHSYTAKATDQAGNTSAPSSTRTVIVDTTKPKVTSVDPAENATAVVPDANLTATFSEAMKATTINTTTFKLFKEGSTTPITASVSYDPIAKKATLNPYPYSYDYLEPEVTYKAVVTTGAQDLAGNALDQNPTLTGNQNKVWYFKVIWDGSLL